MQCNAIQCKPMQFNSMQSTEIQQNAIQIFFLNSANSFETHKCHMTSENMKKFCGLILCLSLFQGLGLLPLFLIKLIPLFHRMLMCFWRITRANSVNEWDALVCLQTHCKTPTQTHWHTSHKSQDLQHLWVLLLMSCKCFKHHQIKDIKMILHMCYSSNYSCSWQKNNTLINQWLILSRYLWTN